MIDKKKLARLLRAFEVAAVNLSWKGNCPPDTHDRIEADYRNARSKLYEYLGIVSQRGRPKAAK